MKTQKTLPNIVVIGGGFAGIATIKRLLKKRVQARITLISDTDSLTYYPALYALVTDAKQSDVVFPYTDIIPESTVSILRGTFTGMDQDRKNITFTDSEGIERSLLYDYAVVALGSQIHYFNIPGLEEGSFNLKSVDAALTLKGHFERVLAGAKGAEKDSAVARLHTLVVGGGPSGIELAATLKGYLKKRAKIHGVDPSLVTIDLIEASSRLLPTMTEKVSVLAEARLRSLGVNIFTNRALKEEDIDGVVLNDMEVKAGTIIWTAGSKISSVYEQLPGITFTDRKRVLVNKYLTVGNENTVFIAGDGAATKYSGLAQTAIHNGEYIGESIGRLIVGAEVSPYTPYTPSFVIPIGKRWAIFSYKSVLLYGIIPSIIRRFIDWRYRFGVTK